MFARIFGALLGLAALAAPVGAAPISTLSSTGQGIAAGSADPYWAITQSSIGSYTLGQAIVTNTLDGTYPIQNGVWALNSFNPAGYPSDSKWIGPTASAGTNWLTSTWTYKTTFDLTGLNALTAEIKGAVAVDNSVKILLNGVPVAAFLQGDERGYTTSAFQNQTFDLTSGFNSGLNTLEFLVQNGNNTNDLNAPTGLRVALSGTADTLPNVLGIPEPTSLAVMGLGLAGIGAYVRRRRVAG